MMLGHSSAERTEARSSQGPGIAARSATAGAAIPVQDSPTLSTNPEASRERFATCRQPDGNREGPTFLSVSIGRRESRPSSSRPVVLQSSHTNTKKKPPIYFERLVSHQYNRSICCFPLRRL